jgi:hypothetical protein
MAEAAIRQGTSTSKMSAAFVFPDASLPAACGVVLRFDWMMQIIGANSNNNRYNDRNVSTRIPITTRARAAVFV